MKILSIGNSFSQDAHRYLHELAENEGEQLTTVNLYIGGCPLKRHWENVEQDLKAYECQVNGIVPSREEGKERFFVSIKETLLQDQWDVITFQQASHDSGEYETYQPYLTELSRYASSLCPNAKQMIHETWAYELDSTHQQFFRYDHSQEKMYRQLKDAYAQAAASIDAPIIPCGDVIQALRRTPPFDYAAGGLSLCRDGYHMSLSFGRYALAAAWFAKLFHKPAVGKGFLPEGCQDTDEEKLALIRKTAAEIVGVNF